MRNTYSTKLQILQRCVFNDQFIQISPIFINQSPKKIALIYLKIGPTALFLIGRANVSYGHHVRRIVLGSGKGGVGRSTLTANLGLAIAKMGKKAIVLDASLTTPNLGTMFKLEKVPYTLNDVLAGEIPLNDVIYQGPSGLKIIPAGVTLNQVKKALPNRLPGILKELSINADFLLIDAPSGLRRETIAALRAGQEVLLITLPEIAAASDMMKTRLIADFLGLKSIGVVVNRVLREEFELTSSEIGHLLNLPVLAEVPEDINIKKAFNSGKIAVDATPNSLASKAIKALARKLVEMRTKKSTS